jgi:xylulokinase
MVNEPSLFKRTAKIFTPHGFCVYKLTGEHVTDYSSIGNLAGIFDIRRYEISSESLEVLSKLASKITKKRLELSKELFGKLCASDKVIGAITSEGQKSTGLRKGTPVVAGGIDAPVSLAAVGGIYAGENSLMLGTSWCWGVLQKRDGAIYPKRLINYPYVISSENLIYSFGGGAYTGGAVDPWFKTFFGGEKNLEELEKSATKVPPGCKGLIFHPFLMGERTPIWNPLATGGFMGLRTIHTKAYAYRAVLEGAAYLHKWNLEEAVKSGLKLGQKTILSDGGAKSKLWRQILADVTQKNMKYLEDFPGTPYGDALLATIGTNNGKKTIIKKWLLKYNEIRYNRKFKDIYEKNYHLFKEIYRTQKTIYKQFPV